MAKITGLNIPPGFEGLFFNALQYNWVFTDPRLTLKNPKLSAVKANQLRGRSFFKTMSPSWQTIPTIDRSGWTDSEGFTLAKYFAYFCMYNANRLKASLSTTTFYSSYYRKSGHLHIHSGSFYSKFTQTISNGDYRGSDPDHPTRPQVPTLVDLSPYKRVIIYMVMLPFNETRGVLPRVVLTCNATIHDPIGGDFVATRTTSIPFLSNVLVASQNYNFTEITGSRYLKSVEFKIEVIQIRGDFLIYPMALSASNGFAYERPFSNDWTLGDFNKVYSGHLANVVSGWSFVGGGGSDYLESILPAAIGLP